MRCKVDISGNPSDSELRKRAIKVWNGEYVTRICKNCGNVWLSVNGLTSQAKIVNQCDGCFEGD